MPQPADDLSRGLHAPAGPPLAPLPSTVADLLRALGAPPRLAAHLCAVHDVARQLVAWAEDRHPGLALDELLGHLGATADARLAFQASFPVARVSPGAPAR
ncbi:hypothetical protein ACFY8X_23785 [Streptomyces tanashiensis]|uniref:hypothetical protein n=1 Tax=Streptomyces tanashiensis TaxID=67367 RepID=UPI0036E4A491